MSIDPDFCVSHSLLPFPRTSINRDIDNGVVHYSVHEKGNIEPVLRDAAFSDAWLHLTLGTQHD